MPLHNTTPFYAFIFFFFLKLIRSKINFTYRSRSCIKIDIRCSLIYNILRCRIHCSNRFILCMYVCFCYTLSTLGDSMGAVSASDILFDLSTRYRPFLRLSCCRLTWTTVVAASVAQRTPTFIKYKHRELQQSSFCMYEM